MKKMITKSIAAVLAALCGAAALAACGSKPESSVPETTAAQSAEATPAAQTTEAATSPASEFVRTVRTVSWTSENGGDTREYFCEQPELTISSADADAVNSEIAQRCKAIFDSYDNGEDMVYLSKGAEYKAYLNGRTLSLVFIDRAANNNYVDYFVYNLDVDSGLRLSDTELISRSGNDADTARAQLRERIAEYFDAKTAEIADTGQAPVEQCRETTLSDEYLDLARYYLADRNALSASFAYQWYAGSGRYYDITEVFQKVPQF